jgi:hypothetical protein
VLGARADEVLQGPRARLGAPWTKDHRVALAATVVAGWRRPGNVGGSGASASSTRRARSAPAGVAHLVDHDRQVGELLDLLDELGIGRPVMPSTATHHQSPPSQS